MDPGTRIDVYVCGWPCQSFSSAGKRLGFGDARGQLIEEVIGFLDKHAPSAFILENVPNLVRSFPQHFQAILETLAAVAGQAYQVTWEVMNTAHHGGLPQARNRIYIVGVHKSRKRAPFVFPCPYPPSSIMALDDVLEPSVGSDMVLAKQSRTIRANVDKMEEALRLAGENPLHVDAILDAGSSKLTWQRGIAPTITASRAAGLGYWSSKRRRPLSVQECMRLQGVLESDFPGWEQVISPRQMGHIAGNAMSVCVLTRIMRSVLVALGMPVQ